MKVLLWLYLLPLGALSVQAFDLHQIRALYHHAPEVKRDASQLNQLMLQVDSGRAAPLLVCYKGANEMIQAKYTLNPMMKLEKFNRGKVLIKKAIAHHTLNLEMRFIRYSIQRNLPAFLGYHDELDNLKNEGFSGTIMNQFFRPFMTGIFLEDQLTTSSRMFEFVFKMFGEGDAAIPAKGMGMIPKQLAECLSPHELLFHQNVSAVEGGTVTTTSGANYKANFILTATDPSRSPFRYGNSIIAHHSVSNMYFTSEKKPFEMPLIALRFIYCKNTN